MDTALALGVDIGGSHITAALVSPEKGEAYSGSATRLEVNSGGDAKEILDTWSIAIRQSLSSASQQQVPIGIAMPGPFDYENGICLIHEQDKFKSLYKLPVKELLATRLDIDPSLIHFMNDACGFLEGEMLGGALRGQRNVMGITLGTGLGSAFSRGDEVVDADLWSHPFKDGIAEDYLSTRWFSRRFNELTGAHVPGVKELAMLAATEPACEIVFGEFADNLGNFIADQFLLHQYLDIVIGGNIAQASSFFSANCESYLEKHSRGARFCIAKLGETAPLIGSAGMAYRKYRQRRNGASKVKVKS